MTNNTEAAPSMDQWLKEAERLVLDFGTAAYRCGDYPGGSAHAYAKRDAARAAAFDALFAHLRASPGAAPAPKDQQPDTDTVHVASGASSEASTERDAGCDHDFSASCNSGVRVCRHCGKQG